MAGKQVYEVPPANVGGSPYCIAVSVRGMDNQKVGCAEFKWKVSCIVSCFRNHIPIIFLCIPSCSVCRTFS